MVSENNRLHTRFTFEYMITEILLSKPHFLSDYVNNALHSPLTGTDVDYRYFIRVIISFLEDPLLFKASRLYIGNARYIRYN